MLHIDLESSTIRQLAELTLALVLFTDASTVDLDGLRRDAGIVGRLLGIGLLLTIAAGGLVAWLVFPELPLATALLIGAILAPTDAALGLPVVTNPAVPIRIRRVLNVESGLNDGIATPFVVLFISLATATRGAEGIHLADAVEEIAIAIVAGAVVGAVGGLLLVAADRRKLTSELSRQIAVLALALGAYVVSLTLGGNGFIAAFVAGLAFGARDTQGRGTCRGVHRSRRDPLVDRRLVGLRRVVRRLADPRCPGPAPDRLRDPQPDGHPHGAGRDRRWSAAAWRSRPSPSWAGSDRAAWPRSCSASWPSTP